MRSNTPQTSKQKTSTTKKSFFLWYFSTIIIVISMATGLIWQGLIISKKAIAVINESNQQIVEKTGIEVTDELNKNELNNVRQIIKAKEADRTLPNRARNIFQYDAYSYFGQESNIQNIDYE